MTPDSNWEKLTVEERRNSLLQSGWKEIEGCPTCFNKIPRAHTGDTYVEPLRKCEKHPKQYVMKALFDFSVPESCYCPKCGNHHFKGDLNE